MAIRQIGQLSLPTGGTTGQVIVKGSDADFDFTWGTAGSGPGTAYVSDDELAAELETALAGYVEAADFTNALLGKQDAGDYATNAQLFNSEEASRDRTNHTGVQPTSTIEDLAEFIRNTVAAFFREGVNVDLVHDNEGNSFTVSATGDGASGLDAAELEQMRDALGVAFVGLGNISVTPNDDADTITWTTTATVNATDAALRDRGTHTGAQAISTITGLQGALDAKGTSNLTIGTTSTTAKAGNYQPTAANISDSTAVGRAVLTAVDAAAARTAIGAGTGSGTGSVTAAGITDSTTTGRAVITAADAAAGRTAIGAGTSNLALGTTPTTAKAGNYQPTAVQISDSGTVGRAILRGETSQVGRDALELGTQIKKVYRNSGTGNWPARPVVPAGYEVVAVGIAPAPTWLQKFDQYVKTATDIRA